MITQCQFLTVAGKIGGSKGSSTLRGYSRGFDWVNYKTGNVCFLGCESNTTYVLSPSGMALRRAKKTPGIDAQDAGGGASGRGVSWCSSWNAGQSQVDVLITCGLLLAGTCLLRSAVELFLGRVLKRNTDAVAFPLWEAPVALSQVIYPCALVRLLSFAAPRTPSWNASTVTQVSENLTA